MPEKKKSHNPLDIELISAITNGLEEQKIAQLLKSGANPNLKHQCFKGGPKQSAIHHAVSSNRTNLIELLLKFGADPNSRGEPCGETPLHNLAFCGDAKTCSTLLRAKADPNILCGKGYTPLYLTVLGLEYGNNNKEKIETLKQLLKHGACPNLKTTTQSSSRATPLMLAGQNAFYPEACEELIKGGANPLTKNERGQTALDLAKEENRDLMLKAIKKYKSTQFVKKFGNENSKTLNIE